MGRMVDLDELVDSYGVAEMLGLARRNAVSEYRRRYEDFPEPVVGFGTGRCLLWLRPEVERWARANGRLS